MRKTYAGSFLGGPLDEAVLMHSGPSPAGKRPIIMLHGRGGSATQPIGSDWQRHVDWVCRNGNYAVLSILGGSAYGWGEDPLQGLITNAKEYMQASVASGGLGCASGRVAFWGYSMGGLGALNWAWRNPTLTAGVVAYATATDLAYFRGVAGFQKEIDFIYGTPTLNVVGAYTLSTSGQTVTVDGDTAQIVSPCAVQTAAGTWVQIAFTGKTSTTLTGTTVAAGTQAIVDGAQITQFVCNNAVALTSASTVSIAGLGSNANWPASGQLLIEVSNLSGAGRWEIIDYVSKLNAQTFTSCKIASGGGANFSTAAGMRIGRTGQYATNGPSHDPALIALATLRAIKVLAYQAPNSGTNGDTIVGPQTTGIDDLSASVNSGQNPAPWTYTPITDNAVGEGHTNFFPKVVPADILAFYNSLTWT